MAYTQMEGTGKWVSRGQKAKRNGPYCTTKLYNLDPGRKLNITNKSGARSKFTRKVEKGVLEYMSGEQDH